MSHKHARASANAYEIAFVCVRVVPLDLLIVARGNIMCECVCVFEACVLKRVTASSVYRYIIYIGRKYRSEIPTPTFCVPVCDAEK